MTSREFEPELVALLNERDRLRVELGRVNGYKVPNDALLAEKRAALSDVVQRIATYRVSHT